MSYLTSYRYRGIELNDGINFALAFNDNALDDRNPVERSFAPRGTNTPVETGAQMRESQIVLNLGVIAGDPATFRARIDALVQLFDTRDTQYYRLERKFAHEAAYSYIEVSPTAVAVQSTQRKVSITLACVDRAWKATAETTQALDIFNGTFYTPVSANYAGLVPYEPELTLTVQTAGGDGTLPLYTRKVTIWAHQPQSVSGLPVKLAHNWDTSALVSGGKMRSDGSDIVVDFGGHYKNDASGAPVRPPAVSRIPRAVYGTAASRQVWMRPAAWPYTSAAMVRNTDRAHNDPAINTTDTSFVISGDPTAHLFRAGTIFKIDDEYMVVSSVIQEGNYHRVTVSSRGALGSTAANHYQFARVLYPADYYIGYGWAFGYEPYFGNDTAGWPDLDYVNSQNNEWVYLDTKKTAEHPEAFHWAAQVDYSSPKTPIYMPLVSVGSDATLQAQRLPVTSFRPIRLVSTPLGYSQRTPSHIRLEMTHAAGAAGAQLSLRKILRNFDQVNESERTIWTGTLGAGGTLDTGYVETDHYFYAGTHYCLQVDSMPAGTGVLTVAAITTARVRFYDPSAPAPVAGSIGTEGGTAYGEFPVEFTITNTTTDDPPFEVKARMAVGDELVVNFHTRELTGLHLGEVSYQNLTWLRLVPGVNQLEFDGAEGSPRLVGELRWRVVK